MGPSTFASAAAGGTSNNTAQRTDTDNDWSRRTNGATQTFRRPSVATNLSSTNHQRDNSGESQPARYVPPHRNGVTSDSRYTKEQLLELWKSQHANESPQRDSLTDLYVGDWVPDHANGFDDGHGWQKNQDHPPGTNGSDAVWNNAGILVPHALTEMTEDEREMFASSVNSPVKIITSQNRDGTTREGLPLRKISVSHNPSSPGGFGLSSPSTTRPGTRRREPSESYPFPTNPLASPKPRDDHRPASPPPALRRRATDFKDAIPEASTDQASHQHHDLGDVARPSAMQGMRGTGNPLTAGLVTPSSPWVPVQPSPGFAPMGAFGAFGNAPMSATAAEKRPAMGSGRAESRFKGLMSKESNDELGRTVREKSSIGNFGRPGDGMTRRSGWPETAQSAFDHDNEGLTGSAALGGGEETSPPPQRGGFQGFGTPQRAEHGDETGFSAFGMTSDSALRGLAQEQPARGQPNLAETLSPTNTNPYQSPEQGHAQTADVDDEDEDLPNIPLPGLGGLMGEGVSNGSTGFGGFGGFSQAPHDRDVTANAGPSRGFPGLGGLGALQGLGGSSGWNAPASAPAPRPLHTGFGDSTFGTPGDIQSPSLAGLGPSSFFGSNQTQSAVPGAGRGMSRMGTFLQQNGAENARGLESQRAPAEEQPSYGFSAPGMPQGEEPDIRPSQGQDPDALKDAGAAQQNPNSASNGPPAAQQRTMVMPDRMRWIYRDPQGATQGPWSGLEMHDWYKAGFFSPELLVKKYEDPEYEPLAQLIRRIGNSREPFLVPQIGIPHGAPQTNWGSGPMPSNGQPPFAASFPSFGTTLTAEQQNALERRKQEEQYLMARQKEHLAQQQMAQRMQIPSQHGMMGQQVQHQSSVPNLHGQAGFANAGPSFQSAQFPSHGHPGAGFPDSMHQQARGFGAVGGGAAVPGLGSDAAGQQQQQLSAGFGQLDLNQQRPGPPGAPNQMFGHQGHYQQDSNDHQQQVNDMLEDRARLEQEQHEHDANQQSLPSDQGHNDRLNEFNLLQHDLKNEQVQSHTENYTRLDRVQQDVREAQKLLAAQSQQQSGKDQRSLTEQVQQAVSAKQSPAAPWGKFDPALPQPFPPAPSQSPLPAPAAQRNRAHVADALHNESRSRSETPSVDTPSASVAPWAKEPAEGARGPSLREIQEAEAKNAAKAEAIAAEARRAAAEREAMVQMQAAAAAAATGSTVGLPSSANWASGGGASPGLPSAGSAWSKVSKPAAAATTAKSMAQIQKEEEARKKRALQVSALAAQQNAALANAVNQVQGKRYAELASKAGTVPVGPSAALPGSSAWTTVGASGKVKPAVATPTAPARSASSGIAPVASVAAKKPIAGKSVAGVGAAAVSAQEDFKRWAAGELRGDLDKSVNADEFVANLLAFPNEVEIVTEAVHSVSNTIDSRHFAEEFLRRRKLAEKGVFDSSLVGKSASPANSGAGNSANGGGWSEVAKKSTKDVAVASSGSKEDLSGSFKVVAAKKKGAKR